MNILKKYKESMAPEVLQASEEEMNNSGDYPEIPHDVYVVEIGSLEKKDGTVVHEGLENRQSKKGDMMISIVFRILEGEFSDQLIFYNKLYSTHDFMRHQNAELLSALIDQPNMKPVINEILKSDNQDDINDLCNEVLDIVSGHEYTLDYNVTNKGYDTFTITEVFDV